MLLDLFIWSEAMSTFKLIEMTVIFLWLKIVSWLIKLGCFYFPFPCVQSKWHNHCSSLLSAGLVQYLPWTEILIQMNSWSFLKSVKVLMEAIIWWHRQVEVQSLYLQASDIIFCHFWFYVLIGTKAKFSVLNIYLGFQLNWFLSVMKRGEITALIIFLTSCLLMVSLGRQIPAMCFKVLRLKF